MGGRNGIKVLVGTPTIETVSLVDESYFLDSKAEVYVCDDF